MQPAVIHQSSSPQHGVSDYVRIVARWFGFLVTAVTVARERRSLMELDDRMLKDIGLGRSEAFGEAIKAFGDLPADRLPRF
jgi:uncharacterized protein YjiS (DUF1127 family)